MQLNACPFWNWSCIEGSWNAQRVNRWGEIPQGE
jgi:hypothetical protein